jgi:hypothetical protein
MLHNRGRQAWPASSFSERVAEDGDRGSRDGLGRRSGPMVDRRAHGRIGWHVGNLAAGADWDPVYSGVASVCALARNVAIRTTSADATRRMRNRPAVLDLIEPHQSSLCRLGGLPVARTNILHGRSDGAMSQRLPDKCQIDVASDQVRRE